MQGGKLDGDAGSAIWPAAGARLADRVDRVLIGSEVTRGVFGSARRLTQHVEGMQVSALLVGATPRERLLDGLAHHELLAEEPHGEIDATPDEGLAAARDEARDGPAQRVLAMGRDELAGDHEAPGRGVHEDRVACCRVGAPIALRDLVSALVGWRGGGPRWALRRSPMSLLCLPLTNRTLVPPGDL